MEVHNNNAADGHHPIQVHIERLKDMISGGSEDLDSWNSLISDIEKTYPDDSNTICLAFDSFLSKFPLCHWHWKRYAYHEARLCNAEKAVEIFERAVESTPFSVGLWVDYCTFAVSSFEDPFDIRRLFTKGISLVGKDYFCHVLWDKYMSFEFSQEKWGFLTLVYVQALRFPTKKLHKYYENFKKLVANLEEEILHLTDDSREVQLKELSDATVVLSNKEIAQIVKDLQDPSDGSVRLKALYRYRYCGDQLYQKACQLEEKIKSFESNIQRRYFQATPLDNDELKNWHDYLDFIEKQDDFDWALKLYERCLISCANYPEFWIRYVDFMETRGGRELAMFALERATKVFSKNVPEIHLFTARYMEQIGDPDGARASFPPINADWDSCFIQYVTNRANMEKRLGNCSAACDIYKRAINMAVKEQKLQCIPMLYIGYYRLRHMITASVEAARDVIIDGINRFPGCGLLYEELIRFAMVHEGTKQLSIVDSVIVNAISPVSDVSQDLDIKDRESISLLFLELVDLCGSISEIRKAWSRHIKLFPQFIRTNTSSKHIGTEKSSLNNFIEQRRNISYVLVNQPSKGTSSGHTIQLSEGEQVHLLTLKDGKQPDQLSADRSLAVVNDKDVTGQQKQLSPEMEDLSSGNGSGKNELSFDPVVQSKDDSSTPMELSHGPSQQRRENLPGPMDFSYDSIPQPGEDVSKSPGPVLDLKEPSRPLSVLEASQADIINRDQDVELKQPPMPVSLENLSLVSGERESQDFVAMHSDDLESGEEIPSSSTGRPQDPVNDGNGPVGCSSPSTCLFSESAQTHPGPVTAESSQLNDTVAVPESGNSKVPNQPGYDQQQQPQRAASQEPCLRDSQGDSEIQQVLEKATVQCQTGTSQGNISSNQCWTLNNMPQQISMSGNHPLASSSPVSYSQPSTALHSVHDSQQSGPDPHHEALNQKSQHISLSENHPQMSSSPASFSQPSTPQHFRQSSQQIGPLHNQEALNQTSQHHYQQQHLLQGQYQQHQPYTSIQQQQMHPHPSQQHYQQQQLIQQQQQQQNQLQTPLLQQQQQQQQYFQQIQSLQYPQQQYLLHQLQYLPQAQQLWQQQFQLQAQQMQPQEGQQTQQHYLQTQEQQLEQYRQSQELAYQMQQHGYQLLLHQYQVHQQQQQQQWQQQGHLQLQQYSHLQQQQYHHLEQQTDEEYNQTHQGQQVVEPHSSGTPAPETESPESARQPHSAEKSGYSVSPYRRAPAHGISPSHSMGTLASEASSFSRTNSSRDQ